ncbi:MAG: energy transducer TonB [Gammaproteobacteria bacterium]|nr:energy transducer TonB [Gammaproteobacteria bacterium]
MNKKISMRLITLVLCLFMSWSGIAQSAGQPNLDMDALLKEITAGRLKDRKVNEQRIREFTRNKADQKQKLAEAKALQAKLEAISEQRELQFENNEKEIGDLQERLNERLGSLKELFGVLQQVALDAQGQFANSITHLEYPKRIEELNNFAVKMGQATELPSIREIEQLWFELQREMTETSKIVVIKHPVVTVNGDQVEKNVTRVGAFNLIADGKYLELVTETGRLVEYSKQPERYLNGVNDLESSDSGMVSFTIDPTRGQLISLLGNVPDLRERVEQGGIIGYLILSLGFVVVLIAIYRYIMLTIIAGRIKKQIENPSKATDNPMGRLLKIYKTYENADLDSLQLKLAEGVLRETPAITRGLSFIKITAALAPLMGLLGTVTGMIITFQAITLFGAGDPKLMAGGISQALVTTVLGLTVAIPTLMLHNILYTRSKRITDVLEQEAVAIIANQAEQLQKR